jgi:hypothetical protein
MPLDDLEADRFWEQAEAAAAFRRSLSDAERHAVSAREAEVDAAFDAVEPEGTTPPGVRRTRW